MVPCKLPMATTTAGAFNSYQCAVHGYFMWWNCSNTSSSSIGHTTTLIPFLPSRRSNQKLLVVGI